MYPQKECPTCGKTMFFNKAGISRNNKEYDAFFSCRDCQYTENADNYNYIGKSPGKKSGGSNRDERIHEAQDRKEHSVRLHNAKSGAAQIVAALISNKYLKGDIQEVTESFDKYFKFIYNYHTDTDKPSEQKAGSDKPSRKEMMDRLMALHDNNIKKVRGFLYCEYEKADIEKLTQQEFNQLIKQVENIEGMVNQPADAPASPKSDDSVPF